MPTGGSFLDGLLTEVIVAIIVFTLGSIAGYLYRVKILAWLKHAYAWLINSEVQVHISRIDKFEQSPEDNLDIDIFHRIQEEYPAIENAGLSENTLRIRANNIPTVLEIRIEEEQDFDDMQPDVVGHKLVIETYSDLRFGYRTYGSLEGFEKMSEDIASIVQTECFTGHRPSQSFVLSRLKEGIPADIEAVEDDELDISGQIQDSTLQMTFRTPQHLTKGIRRYYRPI